MIEVENLTKYYGAVTGIKNLTFQVKKGEVLGFLGPNAAGKTTTMRILTCYMAATAGSARVAGHDVFEEPLAVRQAIGYLPENVPLYPDMKVRAYLSFMAHVKRVPRAKRRSRVEEVIATCRLDGMADRLISQLSKGYRQRVGLAQALVHDPPVLILDEPTIGLDPRQIIETRNLIKSLGGERTIILSTHILPEVSMTCERVVIINEGSLVAVDTPENLTGRIRKSQRLHVELRGSAGEAEKALRDVGGVTGVQREKATEKGSVAFVVDSGLQTDVRAQVASTIVRRGWDLTELRPVAMSLEEVFLRLTTEEEGV